MNPFEAAEKDGRPASCKRSWKPCLRDSKRFADSGAWGWAEFDYDAASDTFTPLGTGAKCGIRVRYEKITF